MNIPIKIIKTITADELSELDFDLYNELFTKKVVDKIYDLDDFHSHPTNYIINKRNNYAGGEPIQIDRLIECLNKIKSKGCNYVSIEHHVDHLGYLFEGIQIENATEKEIEKENKVELNINDNKNKILEEAKQLSGTELIEKLKSDTTLKNIILNN